MTAQTATLTDFLLARIAEDEELARRAGGVALMRGEPWTGPQVWLERTGAGSVEKVVTLGAASLMPAAYVDWLDHSARHDPARVLAECEAKRRIVEAWEGERQRKDIYNRDYDYGLLTTDGDIRNRLASNARWAGLDIALRALAQPYADHPDFRPEWRA